jgi:Protein of unknown function (DUF992)
MITYDEQCYQTCSLNKKKKKENVMKRLIMFILVVGLCSSLALTAPAPVCAGSDGVKIGTLTIKAIEGTGHNLLVTSSVHVDATFKDQGGKTEHYIGEMGIKFGLDISYKKSETLEYLVFSASSAYKTGSYALQGKYFGQKASAEVGVGPSVQILLGGFDKSFSLQPLAVGGTEGAGASAGMGYLYLQKDPKK